MKVFATDLIGVNSLYYIFASRLSQSNFWKGQRLNKHLLNLLIPVEGTKCFLGLCLWWYVNWFHQQMNEEVVWPILKWVDVIHSCGNSQASSFFMKVE